MCAHYDPKATAESVNNDPAIKEICDMQEKPEECLDFLGNTPKANPVYAIETDAETLRIFLTEASEGSCADAPPALKSSFDACAFNYKEVAKKLTDVTTSCKICTQNNGKCPPEEVTKITTALSGSLPNLELCGKALDATNANIKRWIVNVNLGAMGSISKILEVAKKLN
ncbi:hypothetical protein LINGRAHAP2_LOCUS12374 [Linum grandiflorum]